MLDIQNLTQCYGKDKVALDNINLTLKPGIIGLLGPNGAGKSSLMRILSTIAKPTEGQVLWRGNDIIKNPQQLRTELGYLPQSFGVYDNLTAGEFLLYLASLKGLETKAAAAKVDELLAMVNLTEVAKKPLKGFSGGMKQRVGIAQALLNDPKLLIVDEPTVGLDPEERARFRQLLTDMSGERVIILSTHIVSDIESIADQIAIMDAGKLLTFATPETLLQQMKRYVWHAVVDAGQVKLLRQQYCVSHSARRVDGFHVRLVSLQQPWPDAVNVEPNLEDVFLYYTQANRLGAAVAEAAGIAA
ncbi:MAG: ABC-2 type transport system ATP-binding protein [Paraglaciecola sp.]|jgi:ABC-2 type transport system ATP-binding protein